MNLPYQVIDPDGNTVLQAAESCRYSKEVELGLLKTRLHHPPERKEDHEEGIESITGPRCPDWRRWLP